MKKEGDRYMPSNGCEGMDSEAYFDFTGTLCNRCRKDARYRITQEGVYGCSIMLKAFLTDWGQGPEEWQYQGGKAVCTAFVEGDEPWDGTAAEQNEGCTLPGMDEEGDK